MASTIHITDYIRIFSNKIFNISDTDDNGGEPYLILDIIYNIDGERGGDDIATGSRHKFSECNPPSLKALIEEKEPIPLDIMVDPQDAEIFRERISNVITSLVYDCAGTQGLKMLQVVVFVEINLEEEDDVEFLHERRMNSLQKNVYRNVTMAEKKNDICSICLHEMEVEEEIACTPCVHRFHHACISRWFEKSGLCPLCRYKI
ncbi:E3 ubiquitin-protein ligase RNF181 [Dendrobium catenatum]|uniref:E3 ubiquitin-protein ligase SDIR1 n=1 Tax=Dendrobium catenatum TaxID=906689 RepID=A0A2I0WX16_9ASPA|nr:E3 ubiquitin-protein ligase RNF181 [Dendrobium catenatum]PKU80203.1 E3 ubiquitin-protein ligase SDIR1 [Dendrobium catenatum]